MSRYHAAARSNEPGSTEDVFDLTPDDEAELRQALADAEDDERQGKLIPADAFLARLRKG
jgi:hypothetical protein